MRHPNIFRRRIEHVEGNPQAGDWVAVYAQPRVLAAEDSGVDSSQYTPRSEVVEAEPRLFAYGIYNPKSSIAVRLVRWGNDLPDATFWADRIDYAIALRHDVLRLPESTNAYRVLHGEADGFPGIVVDRYADTLSAEVFSFGMMQRGREILEMLGARMGISHFLMAPSPGFSNQESIDVQPVRSNDFPTSVTIQEATTKYRIHFGTGHKTGFFCDQRDNRTQLAAWSPGKSVLDLCCYTGGFSVRAATDGKAAEVTGVDIDEEPLQLAKKNANINHAKVRYCQADAFAFMRDMLALGRQYDIVILDPPKLIRSRLEIEEGTRKHHDMNKLAMQLVKPAGMMLSCTCAGLMDQASFDAMLQSAVRSTGKLPDGSRTTPREVQIIRRCGAAGDHPIAVHCPETEYFKSAWMRIT